MGTECWCHLRLEQTCCIHVCGAGSVAAAGIASSIQRRPCGVQGEVGEVHSPVFIGGPDHAGHAAVEPSFSAPLA